MANMSIHDNSFMTYYNFVFTDLAGNLVTKLSENITFNDYYSHISLYTSLVIFFIFFFKKKCFLFIHFCRPSNQSLAINIITDTNSYNIRFIFIFCIVMGSKIYDKQETMEVRASTDNIQFNTSYS